MSSNRNIFSDRKLSSEGTEVSTAIVRDHVSPLDEKTGRAVRRWARPSLSFDWMDQYCPPPEDYVCAIGDC
jgi:hypothetical protein